MTDRESVLQDQRHRWEFLLLLYKHRKTLPYGQIQSVHADEISDEIKLDKQAAEQAMEYLVDAGLLEIVAFGPEIRITKLGIDEVEDAITRPDRQTPHFGPINVLHVAGDIQNSQLQQGTHHSTQTLTLSSAHQEALIALLPEIRSALQSLAPHDVQAAADVDTIDRQVNSPKPRQGVIRECLGSVREVVEKAGGAVLAAKILQWMRQVGWLS